MPNPNPSEQPKRHEFLTLLGLAPPVSEEDVKQAYLDKVKTAHPDKGGDPKVFMRLEEAFQQATQYAQFRANRRQWLGQWVEQYADQQQLIEQIRATGGEADVESTDWVTQSIGVDFATVLDTIVRIRLAGNSVDDQTLARLLADRRLLAGVTKLELIGVNLTDQGLAHLKNLPRLQHLDLSQTPVSVDALETLLPMLSQLESLIISGTGIDWWSRKKLAFTHRSLRVTT